MSQCTQCHAVDPAQAGAVGPAGQGRLPAFLEARGLRGDYPAGYTPKRSTRVMPPMPALAPDIDALAAYLRLSAPGGRFTGGTLRCDRGRQPEVDRPRE